MDREEAKFILSALRNGESGGGNRKDIEEALRMAREDEELADWYAELQQFDSVMRDRLSRVPVPRDLKTNILTGIKVSKKPGINRRAVMLLVAACVAVGAFAILWQPQPNVPEAASLADFREAMIDQLGKIKAVDRASSDPEIIQAYLKTRSAPVVELSGAIDGKALFGCKVLEWHGHKVTLICFGDKAGGKRPDFHLMTIDAAAFEAVADEESSQVTIDDWSYAVWRKGGRVYFVAGKETGERDLREMIPLG